MKIWQAGYWHQFLKMSGRGPLWDVMMIEKLWLAIIASGQLRWRHLCPYVLLQNAADSGLTLKNAKPLFKEDAIKTNPRLLEHISRAECF